MQHEHKNTITQNKHNHSNNFPVLQGVQWTLNLTDQETSCNHDRRNDVNLLRHNSVTVQDQNQRRNRQLNVSVLHVHKSLHLILNSHCPGKSMLTSFPRFFPSLITWPVKQSVTNTLAHKITACCVMWERNICQPDWTTACVCMDVPDAIFVRAQAASNCNGGLQPTESIWSQQITDVLCQTTAG